MIPIVILFLRGLYGGIQGRFVGASGFRRLLSALSRGVLRTKSCSVTTDTCCVTMNLGGVKKQRFQCLLILELSFWVLEFVFTEEHLADYIKPMWVKSESSQP